MNLARYRFVLSRPLQLLPVLFGISLITFILVRSIPGDPARAGPSGKNPFQLLGEALDQMVAAGVMSAARRPGAEFLAWSAVHGLAVLVLDGPLGPVVGPQMQQVGQRLLDMVEQGLSA